MRSRTAGMALPVALVLLMALTTLAHGALILARRELQASWSFRRAVQARLATEGGLHLALRDLGRRRLVGTPGTQVSPLMAGVTADGYRYQVDLLWIDRELFLLEGRNTTPSYVGVGRTGWLGWRMDPLSRLGSFRAVAETGGRVALVGSGRGGGSDLLANPGGWPPEACAPYTAPLDSLFPGGSLPATGPLGSVRVEDSGPGRTIPPLGLLTGSTLLGRGKSTGAIGPPGGTDSGCPGDGTPVFLTREGSLVLNGDRLCGILVVQGDLHLTGGHRFQGLALIGGNLDLDAGAELEGMVRVQGSLRVLDGSRVEGSACAVLRALEGAATLADPVTLPWGSRIHPL